MGGFSARHTWQGLSALSPPCLRPPCQTRALWHVRPPAARRAGRCEQRTAIVVVRSDACLASCLTGRTRAAANPHLPLPHLPLSSLLAPPRYPHTSTITTNMPRLPFPLLAHTSTLACPHSQTPCRLSAPRFRKVELFPAHAHVRRRARGRRGHWQVPLMETRAQEHARALAQQVLVLHALQALMVRPASEAQGVLPNQTSNGHPASGTKLSGG